jgi:large exoprotein involved in heme utilization and adhesion
LNRVVGADASQIQGKINANGQVYLVNPNGVVFSKTAQVDVGGLVATTHNIKDADFIAGKNHFTQDGASGTVANHGTINVPNGGVVALIGEQVTNNTPKGTTALAAGKTVDLDFKGDGLVEVKVSEAALNAQITNQGAIQADGGRVVLTAKAANSLIDSVINQEGVIRAQGMTMRNGEIILDGGYVLQTGTLDASGNTGGKIAINARAILDAGKTNADGTAGNGGSIHLKASDAIIQTASADTHANGTTQGGTVHLEATNSVYSSGKLATTGQQGGTINVLSSDRVVLAAADIDASGTNQGGLVRIGGDFHGTNPNIKNAKTRVINGATKIKADDGKGKVVVWSDQQTDYEGSISANKAGEIEVSSKGLLNYAGRADAGVGGSLLLDPKNIVIAANAGVANYALIDPRAAAGNGFGQNTTVLGTTVNGVFTENGNIAVSSAGDDFAASNSGATYLFNTTTGALLSALTGSSANDQVGSNGITALSNGNYVVSRANWNNGTITRAGAATWGNGVTGTSGVVSSANSLVGSSADDVVSGENGSTITALTNGNYVVGSSQWDNGTGIANAGAATWGNGATGISGTINAANSLVATRLNDKVSGNGITALSNGNYVVASSQWDNGAGIVDAGAATWGNGLTGIRGIINASNSLIGLSANDNVARNSRYGSRSGVTALSNGNYVVISAYWGNGLITNVGAATWGNGATGIFGAVSTSNSLTGTVNGDNVGSDGVFALTNGNYVVGSSDWKNGSTRGVGAATWGSGTAGITGAVSSTNSLIGSRSEDWVSYTGGIIVLSNGNYVVSRFC